MSRYVTAGLVALLVTATSLSAGSWEGRHVYLEDGAGERIRIATLSGSGDTYTVAMNAEVFTDHFLSMRPFKCLDGPEKTWCHIPYPYEIARETSGDLTDLEYDFLFVWKRRGDYGINMWNGVYYVLSPVETGAVGQMHEINMDILAVPPDAGELRPIKEADLQLAEPDGHWLPRLIIE